MISFIISRRYVVKNIRSLVGMGVSPLVGSKKIWYHIVNLYLKIVDKPENSLVFDQTGI